MTVLAASLHLHCVSVVVVVVFVSTNLTLVPIVLLRENDILGQDAMSFQTVHPLS
jgi:hypothetical protein